MLHIILLILKIIGWILLAILGLLVVLVCAVLFTPVRYEVKGKCDGDLSSLNIGLKFSYFLRLVSGDVQYAEEKLVWKLRIAWKRMSSEEEIQDVAEETAEEVKEVVTSGVQKAEEFIDEIPDSERTKPPISDSEKPEPRVTRKPQKTSEETVMAKKTKPADKPEEKPVKETADTDKESFFEKLSCKFQEICDKIKELIRKKDIIMAFLTHEVHKAAFIRAISELKRLILKLKPKKMSGNLEFGFEDPSLTGKVLAGISMLYPYFADYVQVDPRFEEKVFKGDIYIKGGIAARPFASVTIRLLLDKNIRTTIKHAKKFKLG